MELLVEQLFVFSKAMQHCSDLSMSYTVEAFVKVEFRTNTKSVNVDPFFVSESTPQS